MKKIYKEAKKIYKSTNGNITVPGIIRFLESVGYSVVFFNTEEGDYLLQTYELYPCKTNALTYCGNTKVVFVDNLLHPSDKVFALLHECGHILLGHLDDMIDHRVYENEAEAFAYTVLHYTPPKTFRNILLCTLASLLLITGTLYFSYTPPDPMLQTATQVTAFGTVDEIVYITPTGKKYHRETCYYAKHSNSTRVYRSEAEKTREPCALCNP